MVDIRSVKSGEWVISLIARAEAKAIARPATERVPKRFPVCGDLRPPLSSLSSQSIFPPAVAQDDGGGDLAVRHGPVGFQQDVFLGF